MRAASILLADVSPLVGDAIFNQVLTYATDKLMKNDWLNQYIGMCALGSALNGPNSQLIYSSCSHMWESIFQLLNSS